MQEPSQALQLLLSALQSLSATYDTVFAVLELPDQFLQQLLRHAVVLQQAAVIFGIQLQLLCSFTAADTQVGAWIPSSAHSAAHSSVGHLLVWVAWCPLTSATSTDKGGTCDGFAATSRMNAVYCHLASSVVSFLLIGKSC
jgi:hypothetical protein